MRSKTFSILFTAIILAAVAGGSFTFIFSGWGTYTNYSDPYTYVPARPASSIAGMGMTPYASHVVIFVLDGVRFDTFCRTSHPIISSYSWANWTDVQCSTLISASKIGYAVITSGCNSSESEVVTNEYVGLFRGDSLWNDTIRHGGTTAVVGGQWWWDLFKPWLNYSITFDPSMQGEGTTLRNSTNGATPLETVLPDYRDSLISQYAQTIVNRHQPTFMVVHFTETDEAAHANGSLSQSYVNAFQNEDAYIGQVLGAYSTAGILGSTLVVVMADHGHVDQGGHGGTEPEVLHIPMIIRGPGVISGTYSTPTHQNAIASTLAALLGWEIPSDASGTVLFSCLTLNSNATQQAIYRINLADIRLAQAKITLQKTGYLAGCQAKVDESARHLTNARGNYTAANYAVAITEAVASETISRSEIGSALAAKQTEEVVGRTVLVLAIIVVIAVAVFLAVRKWGSKAENAVTKEKPFLDLAVLCIAAYFLLFMLGTLLTGWKFSASYVPESVIGFVMGVLVPTLIALVPTAIVFFVLSRYLRKAGATTRGTTETWGATVLVSIAVIYLLITMFFIIRNGTGLSWYAPNMNEPLEYFYIGLSAGFFGILGLSTLGIGLLMAKLLGSKRKSTKA